ncbi:MAG: InlB B-repeat-containing protein, partial [Treponema sp.]|nr:InlB B-repeat-containing protein [Treponema sp.]
LITTHPQPQTTVIQGNISGSLTVDAIASGRTSFQWFSNTENCNENGTKIEGETGRSFEIPQTLTAGTYYYFAEVSAVGVAVPLRSTVAVVDVNLLVTFDRNNNDPGTEANPQTITVVYNTVVETLPSPPTRQGWVFEGWNTASDGTGVAFTVPATITENITVFAQWSLNVFYVSAGNVHNVAITTNGELWAWGRNGNGKLGDGTTIARHSPVRIRITP